MSAKVGGIGIFDVAWENVVEAEYFCRQVFTYTYPEPIAGLVQELYVEPPENYPGQVLLRHSLKVSPHTPHKRSQDDFGNTCIQVTAPLVKKQISFEEEFVVQKKAGVFTIPFKAQMRSQFLRQTGKTRTNAFMRKMAGEISSQNPEPLELAKKLNAWVFENMRYEYDVTQVTTTAAEALQGGRGVCQDYAHIMLAMARYCGLPARYVSGHLFAPGSSHAWVEILLNEKEGEATVYGFDPTNGCEVGAKYFAVATGKDYSDVPPLAGVYESGPLGRFSYEKELRLARVLYMNGETMQENQKAQTLVE